MTWRSESVVTYSTRSFGHRKHCEHALKRSRSLPPCLAMLRLSQSWSKETGTGQSRGVYRLQRTELVSHRPGYRRARAPIPIPALRPLYARTLASGRQLLESLQMSDMTAAANVDKQRRQKRILDESCPVGNGAVKDLRFGLLRPILKSIAGFP